MTLRGEMLDDSGVLWRSWADFEVDAEGRIDLDARAPLAGSYSGADTMGLVWGMERPPDASEALFDSSKTTPLALRILLEQAGHVVASAEIERLRRAQGVRRLPVDEDGICGVLYLPPGAGPHPALIHLSGSGGGLSENAAAAYASRGFACLALAYFGYPKRPDSLADIPLEYFGQGLRWLGERREVDASRIGLQGASRGGELVLLLATVFPEVRAVVSYAPSHVVWGGFGPGSEGRAAWTLRDEPVSHVDPMAVSPAVIETMQAGGELAKRGEPVPLTPNFLAYLEDGEQVTGASIPVERANAAILLISGDDDQMWPSAVMAKAIEARLKASSYAYPFHNLVYAGAGHLIASPTRPTTVSCSPHPVDGTLYAYGGSAAADAAANRDSWPRVVEFFAKHLG
jgi:dienelactone hydrolase